MRTGVREVVVSLSGRGTAAGVAVLVAGREASAAVGWAVVAVHGVRGFAGDGSSGGVVLGCSGRWAASALDVS